MKLFSRIAYHGSPAKFDKFDFAFMGTGEGFQAHGWGIYLAVNRSTSESYRPDRYVKIAKFDGKTVPEKLAEFGIIFEPASYCDLFISKYLSEIGSIQGIEKKIERRLKTLKMRGATEDFNNLSKVAEVIPELEKYKFEFEDVRIGMLATVELPDDIVLVEENTPLIEQSEFIQNICKKVFADDFGEETSYDKTTFSNLLNQLKPYLKPVTDEDDRFVDYFLRNINAQQHLDFFTEYPDDGKRGVDNLIRKMELTLSGISLDDFYSKIQSFVEQSKITVSKDQKSLQKTFRDLYQHYNPKEASLELCQNGIDGISYNGRSDDECIVLINLDKAKIIERDM